MVRSKTKPEQAIKQKKDITTIRTSVLFHIAVNNFFDKKLRSFLTVFGVVIGVCAIFFLLSFGLGIKDLVTEQVVGNNSLKSIDVTSPNSKIVKLDKETTSTIFGYAHVNLIGVQYSFPGIMTLNGGESDAVAYGINQQYQSVSSLTLIKGRLLEASDDKAVVLNSSALKAIGIDDVEDAINKQVKISVPLKGSGASTEEINNNFTIVGVIESGSGSELFVPSKIFDSAGVPVYERVKVVVDEVANVDLVRSRIESLGLETVSLTDTLTEINNIFKFFNIILVGFGSIGMIVAILGMFNTLTISLLERTKEIGLMMALGARRSDMRKLFILEAVLISMIGAIIGIAIAIVMGKLVNLYINIRAAGRGVVGSFDLFATPLWIVLLLILATMAIGTLVVYFPARRAERINPIDALRHE